MKNNNKGFSLVELIVVIAIMAILAAVAVIGVSVYIPKAQQASDKQMVADIEYVLNLHAQSTPEDVTAGYIILTPNGAQASGEFVTDVLVATYGEDWANELKLAYDGWENDGLLSLAAGQEHASSVNSSSYLTGSTPSALLDNVATITNAATGLLDSLTSDTQKYTQMCGAFNGFEELYESAGLTTENVENGTKFSEDVTNAQLSNLMVLAVSNEVNELTAAQVNAIAIGDTNNYPADVSMGTQLAIQYAVMKAFTTSEYASGTAAVSQLTKVNSGLDEATNKATVEAALDSFFLDDNGNQDAELYAKFMAYCGIDDDGNVNGSDTLTNDMNAFQAIMEAVDSVSSDYLNADSLADSSLYTSGAVVDHLNSYLTATSIVSGLDETTLNALASATANGGIVVLVSQTGVIVVSPSHAMS